MRNSWRVGRRTHVVQCRVTSGTAVGGSLAFPGTLAEAQNPDVIVVAMSPSSRHITKPVCQITYSLRAAGIEASVLVLSSGTGTSSEVAPTNTLGTSVMSISEQEVEQLCRHRLAIIHVGNVPSHFIPKISQILTAADMPAIVISQAPVSFDQLSREGIRVKNARELGDTAGWVVDMVDSVIRGQRCTPSKIDEIVAKTRRALMSIDNAAILSADAMCIMKSASPKMMPVHDFDSHMSYESRRDIAKD